MLINAIFVLFLMESDKVKDDMRMIYDEIAHVYGNAYKNKAGRYFMRRKLSVVRRLGRLNKSDNMLEVGCADGCYTYPFASNGCRITALDISEGNINICNMRNKLENVRFVVGDAENLKFKDESFDKVVSLSTLRYVPNLPKALSEINRVTKKNGTVVIDFPNKYNPWFNYLKPALTGTRHKHDNFFTRKQICRLMKRAGFRKIKIETILFIPKVVPDWSFPFFKLGDIVLQNMPFTNRLGAIIVVKGEKV